MLRKEYIQMAYTHLTMKELIWIENYYDSGKKVTDIAKKLNRAIQTIYNVVNFLKNSGNIQEYYDQYKENKSRCGAKKKVFNTKQITYIKKKVDQGWSPDVIIGRNELPLGCTARTLYRRFKDSELFDPSTLPMKGKRKPNGYQEKRGKQHFRRTIEDRQKENPQYEKEFGHLEGDTIVGKDHKSAVLTLVERISKLIIPIKISSRKASDVRIACDNWFAYLPRNLFKSITFDCGKEFSDWQAISNVNDINIYFADPGCPSQRGLNEHSNGLLRRDGLSKGMDFTDISQEILSQTAHFRNEIPRKSLGYRTPIEVFIDCCKELGWIDAF